MDYSCSRHQLQRVAIFLLVPKKLKNSQKAFLYLFVGFEANGKITTSGYQRAGCRPTIDTICGPMQAPTTGTNSTRHVHWPRLYHLGLDSARWIIHVVDTNASGYQRAGFRPTIDTIRGPMQTPTTGTNSTRHFHCVWYGFGRGPAVSRWITEAKTEAVQSPAHPQKNQTHLGMLVASLVPVFSTLIFQTNRP